MKVGMRVGSNLMVETAYPHSIIEGLSHRQRSRKISIKLATPRASPLGMPRPPRSLTASNEKFTYLTKYIRTVLAKAR
jgi:hypothetical protein